MRNFTIMVAEDEALIALDMMEGLRERGIEVVGPCMSLAECLNCIDGPQSIDGAILDVDLSGEDVFPAAMLLRKRGIPFVFHSGHCTRDNLPSELKDALLFHKPASLEMLAGGLRPTIN